LVRQHTPKRMLHDEEHAAFPFYIVSTFFWQKTLFTFLRIDGI